MTNVDPFTTRAEGANEDQKNPLYRYTTDKGGYYNDEYAFQLQLVSKCRWLKPENFEQYYRIAKNNYAQYTTPSKKFYNADGYYFAFNINKSEGLHTDRGNATFAEYIKAKMASFDKYMEKYYAQ